MMKDVRQAQTKQEKYFVVTIEEAMVGPMQNGFSGKKMQGNLYQIGTRIEVQFQ